MSKETITAKEYLDLPYKLKNKFLSDWSFKYGITATLNDIRVCLLSGFGYMGETRVNANFIRSLDENDKNILRKGYAFLLKK